jgi:hypothetical protein
MVGWSFVHANELMALSRQGSSTSESLPHTTTKALLDLGEDNFVQQANRETYGTTHNR